MDAQQRREEVVEGCGFGDCAAETEGKDEEDEDDCDEDCAEGCADGDDGDQEGEAELFIRCQHNEYIYRYRCLRIRMVGLTRIRRASLEPSAERPSMDRSSSLMGFSVSIECGDQMLD